MIQPILTAEVPQLPQCHTSMVVSIVLYLSTKLEDFLFAIDMEQLHFALERPWSNSGASRS
jgi:hypothetical protein